MKKIEWAFILLAFLLALFIRLNYNDDLFSFNLATANFDAGDYHWLAKNLCRLRDYHAFWGTGHDYHIMRLPGQPLYMALVYSIFGMHFFALRLVDTTLSALSAVMVYLIVRDLAGRKAALLAMVLAVFYRPAVYFSTRLFSENLFCFLMLLMIYVMSNYRDRGWAYAIGGVISGYLILTRPMWMGTVPFLLVWIIVIARDHRFRKSLYFLVSLLYILVPWVIYCIIALQMGLSLSMFSCSIGAENTWSAHNPDVGDFTQMGAKPGRYAEHEWTQLTLLRMENYKLSEVEYVNKLTNEAKRFLLADPLRCIRLGIKRLYRSWLGSGIMDGQGTIFEDTGKNPYGVIYLKNRIFNPAVYFGDEEILEQFIVNRRLHILGLHIPLISFEGTFYLLILSLIFCVVINLNHFFSRAGGFLRGFSLILLIIVGYSAINVFGIPIQRYRLPVGYLIVILAGTSLACAGAPLFRFVKSVLNRVGIKSPSSQCNYDVTQSRGKRSWKIIFSVAVIIVIIIMARFVYNLSVFRSSLIQSCAYKRSTHEILSLMSYDASKILPSLNYQTVWRRQMEGVGDLGDLLGKTVLWKGEATWIHTPTRADFKGEVYLAEAQKKFAPQMKDPGFFRLIVDSYESPGSIGSGRAVVISSQEALASLKEGDHVAVLGKISGTEYQYGVSSIIVCGENIFRLDEIKFEDNSG